MERVGWLAFEALTLASAAVLVAAQLFVSPVLGVADSGDFEKLTSNFCYAPDLTKPYPIFDYAISYFRYDRDHCSHDHFSTALLPLAAAVVMSPPGLVEVRFLGAVYSVLFLGTLWGWLRLMCRAPARARLLAPIAFLVAFCNAAYVPSFNSFFMDTAALMFLLLSAPAACQLTFAGEVRGWEYTGALFCFILLAGSKPQHALLGLCLAPALWFDFGRAAFPRRVVRIAAISVLAGVGLFTLGSTLPWYRAIAFYDALFFQFLPHSTNVTADLGELGLDPGMVRYVGQHAYSPGTRMQDRDFALDFARRVTPARMVKFYVTHPRLTLLALEHALEEGSLQRVRMKAGDREYRLGNYMADSGKPPGAQSEFFTFWTRLKVLAFGHRPWLYFGWMLAIVAAWWVLAWRRSVRCAVMAGSLTAMLAIALAAPLFDAVDTGRHLFLYNALLDLSVCGFIGLWLARPSSP